MINYADMTKDWVDGGDYLCLYSVSVHAVALDGLCCLNVSVCAFVPPGATRNEGLCIRIVYSCTRQRSCQRELFISEKNDIQYCTFAKTSVIKYVSSFIS
jgi:hypothetical protein